MLRFNKVEKQRRDENGKISIHPMLRFNNYKKFDCTKKG